VTKCRFRCRESSRRGGFHLYSGQSGRTASCRCIGWECDPAAVRPSRPSGQTRRHETGL